MCRVCSNIGKHWSQDIKPVLEPRKIWQTEKRNVRMKDIAVVADSNAIRGKWSVRKVLEVFPRSDGHMCNVKVKLQSGEYTRPVTKIAVIYPAEGYDD